MSETADGLGGIVTGALAAREVDGGAPAGHGAEGAGGACLNCGTVRVGGFCHACGQSGHVHRTVGAIGHDIAHGVFHFEGRFWATLPLLVRRPGELTRRYVHGERAKFVSPMALFLFSVFLLFAAVNRVTMPDVAGAGAGLAKAREQLSDQADKARDRLDALVEQRADRLDSDPRADVAALDRKIAAARGEADKLARAARAIPAGAARPGDAGEGGSARASGIAHGIDAVDARTGVASLDRQIAHVRDNPELYAYKLKTASYKFSWALIPISVPFIWLLFAWRRDIGLYDHAIFAIYSLSFMTLLVVGLMGLWLLGVRAWLLWCAFVIVPPVHMYRQLKGAYLIGRFGAAWRTAVLLISTSIAGGLFFALLLWLEAE